ncbi:MAG: tellurite resistance TerB C-terminal domain-containing protein [Succinivibrionaceae bacterium]
MSKSTPIFYNIKNYSQILTEASRYHVSDIVDLQNLPRNLKERFEILSRDIKSYPAIEISIEELFIILNLKTSDLQKYTPQQCLKILRKLLKIHSKIEIAPPGNLIDITLTEKIRLTPCYDLEMDPDIVTAKQNIGNKTMGSMIQSRIKKAEQKINNFNLFIHIFESLFLTTNNKPLNTNQLQFLNEYIAQRIIPENCMLYIRCCLSLLIEKKPYISDLSLGHTHLKPITNINLEETFIDAIAHIASLSYDKLDFMNSPLRAKLLKKYKEYTHIFDIENSFVSNNNTLIPTPNFSQLSHLCISDPNLFVADIFSQIDNIPYYKDKKESTKQNIKAKIRVQLEYVKFIDPLNIRFATDEQVIYIADIAISNSNFYVCLNSELLKSHPLNFAITLDNKTFSTKYLCKTKTFPELSPNSRRLFALGLTQPNITSPTNILGNIIGANLEYRILVEGFLGIITTSEVNKAIIWLFEKFKNFYIINNSLMYDFRKNLKYFGDIISITAFFFPKLINNNQQKLIDEIPYFSLYAQMKLSEIMCKTNAKKSDLISLIFQAFINSSDSYNLNIRTNSINAHLLSRIAYKYVVDYFEQNRNIYKSILNNIIISNAPFDIEDAFNILYSYKKVIISKFLPYKCSLNETGLNIINKIVKEVKANQVIFLKYLNNKSKSLSDEIVFKLIKYSLHDVDDNNQTQVPLYIENFKKALLSQDIFKYEQAKNLFKIQINSRTDCLKIMEYCAKSMGLYMYPSVTMENYEHYKDGFSYITFNKVNYIVEKDVSQILVPFRLALNIATGINTFKILYNSFKAHILNNSNNNSLASMLTKNEVESILKYIQIVIDIKIKKGDSQSYTYNLRDFCFTDEAKRNFKEYLNIVIANARGDILHCIYTINKRLNEPFLNDLIYKKTSDISFSNIYSEQTSNKELDTELIASKTAETLEVQNVLNPIFNNNENDYKHGNEFSTNEDISTIDTKDISNSGENKANNDDNKKSNDEKFQQLPENCRKLLIRLLQIGEFSSKDFKLYCNDVGLMPEGALEIINTWAYEQFDCSLIEEDEPMFFDKELLLEFLQK